jgi:poly(3-hydroxybutyrate) depolymerase
LERLLISQIQYEQRDDEMDMAVAGEGSEVGVPDSRSAACPGVVMIHGAGGDGKSMTAWTLAKHVARGLPFSSGETWFQSNKARC